MQLKKLLLIASAAAMAVAGLAIAPSAQAAATLTNGCIDSVPEPGTTTPVKICYSLYKPDGASATNQVPVVFHSHGWGGSRTNSATAFGSWLNEGFGVISFDQRGFGQSGGKAHVQNPDFEGQDVQGLVDFVAAQDWVKLDGPGDPVIGAIGGSYGGGYQMVGAFTDLLETGSNRFNALAPEITWYDLKESLAPAELSRTAWVSALYAAGARAHTDEVHKGFAYGAATGNWPKGELGLSNLDTFFFRNGPKWHADNGRKLDIPVLFGQGVTDNLFNLNQGIKNFDNVLTPAARAQSIFIGYNGGHVLPSAFPAGTGVSGDPCSKELGGTSFADMTLRFFKQHLKGEASTLSGQGAYHLATAAGACTHVADITPDGSFAVGTITATAGAGAPQSIKLADGPIRVAGTPFVDASVTTVTPDARAFFALAIGTSAADARIIQNNMMPIREADPVTGAARTIELPAIAVDVPAGQSLFLTVSPFSDMSAGSGSRISGPIVLANTVVRVPVV